MDLRQDSLTPLLNQCVAENGYPSPFVLAFSEQRAVVKGCESAASTVRRGKHVREVHVFNVKNEVGRVDGHPAHVTIHIQPYSATGLHYGPLVIVLVSRNPIVWRLRTERMSNQTRIILVMREGSTLEKLNRVRQKIKRESMPTDTQQLIQWVRNKYKTITSMVETPHAYTYLKKVGIIPGAAPTCVLVNHFESPNSVVKYLEPQSTRACSVSRNEGEKSRDIHVIELHSANTTAGPGADSEVLFDISTTSSEARSRRLLVVLKGSGNNKVTWKIQGAGMRGDLDIITPNVGDTDGVDSKQTVRVTTEKLDDYKGDALQRWVVDKYGPLVSYTDIAAANRIHLVVDGLVRGPKVAATSSADKQGSQHDQHVGETDPPTMTLINKSPFQFPARTRAALSQAMVVNCRSRGIYILLHKNSLRIHGVRKEHLTLLAPQCGATANSSHYILHTDLEGCGTKRVLDDRDEIVNYRNAIMLRDVDLSDTPEDLGSADLSEMRSLLESTDHTRVDDEDYTATPSGDIKVDFGCEYAVGRKVLEPRIDPEIIKPSGKAPLVSPKRLSYTLEVYTDSQYSRRVVKWPHNVSENDRIYVQATVTTPDNDQVRAVLHSCWISPWMYDDKFGFQLIQEGCVTDSNIIRIEGNPGHSARFSFAYYDYWEEPVIKEYIACRLSMCAIDKSAQTSDMHMCVSQDQYCAKQNINTESGDRHSIPHLTVSFSKGVLKRRGTSRPLDVEEDDETNRSPTDKVKDSATSQQCQEIIRVEGLDSGTVVGISFAAFIIGVLLTAALWVIHTHTGPYRAANRPRSTETSGESTPSSTAPITIHHIHT